MHTRVVDAGAGAGDGTTDVAAAAGEVMTILEKYNVTSVYSP